MSSTRASSAPYMQICPKYTILRDWCYPRILGATHILMLADACSFLLRGHMSQPLVFYVEID